ncbi:hypothetical protein EIP86_002462, partial [Pleurotus ostreatoroseus]
MQFLNFIDGIVFDQSPFSNSKEDLLRGHTKQVVSLRFSPDGTRMISGGLDGHVLVWELDNGQPRMLQDFNNLLSGAVTALEWMGNDLFLTGSADGSITIYRHIANDTHSEFPARFRPIHTITAHTGPVEALATDMHKHIASAGGRTVHLWVFNGITVIKQETPGASRECIPRGLAFLSGGEKLLVGYLESHEIICFQVNPWLPLSVRQVETRVGYLSVSSDEKLVLIPNLCDGVDVYRLPELDLVKTLKRSRPSHYICQAVFACDARFIIAGNEDGQVVIYDLFDGEPVKQLSRPGKK